VLDLGDRGPCHIGEGHRLAPFARALVAGEQQQVLGIAAHPGDHVVHREQAGKQLRVVLVLLQ
jgi:hypothetical protein